MKKTPFDPRKFMEMAIKVMQQSVCEGRDDNKASPLVGAVLIKPDGSIETAYRGELREGDHAEFTLLERKNHDQKLDGSKLFATLEPCAPGARKEPKKSCAERIVWARIKEVWVGIADPDPTVDRKGIKYLENKGVTVRMFDRDLQEVILKENKDFIEQAQDRAMAAEKEKKQSKSITLSSLENSFALAAMDDFSKEALEQYRAIVGIKDEVETPAFRRRLAHQGLLVQKGTQYVPTGFGMLLFGKEPRLVMPQAGLLATIHYSPTSEEMENFEDPMVLIPDRLEKWLSDKLPNLLDRSKMRRAQFPPMPFEMVREAVVNALIHRDYSIEGAKCQLTVTEDAITVQSPGGPLAPITLKQLQEFNAPMLSRNPQLHFVFAQMGMAEERGLGIKTLKNRAHELGLPIPKYSFEAPYLILTLYRSPEAAVSILKPDVLKELNNSEKEGWKWLATKRRAKSSEYAKAVEVEDRTARRHLNHFEELGLVRKIGSGPSTEYEAL